MVKFIDAGLTPMPFWEGDCTARLETIADIPAGKCIYQFESTDLVKAREILGGTVCIRGGVPASLLIAGTPDEVRAQCKKIIDVVGKDGGLIMEASVGIPDEAKAENVKAMFEFTQEYGRYR
jgi:uroporphyrinogen-III decarboxylase